MSKINLPSNFLSSLHTGKLRIICDDILSINFVVDKNIRIIDIMDMPILMSKKPGIIKQLSEAKDMAKNLKKKNLTLDVKFQGKTVLKLGKNAHPKLAKIVTLSNDIEITDFKKLKKLSSIF